MKNFKKKMNDDPEVDYDEDDSQEANLSPEKATDSFRIDASESNSGVSKNFEIFSEFGEESRTDGRNSGQGEDKSRKKLRKSSQNDPFQPNLRNHPDDKQDC